MKLNGTTVVVTGAARGIGLAIAELLASRGAHIALVDLDAKSLDEAASKCASQGVRVERYAADTSNEQQVVSAFDRIVSDFGRLDGVVNNAGIVKDGLLLKVKEDRVVEKMSLAQWQSVIDINLTGVFLCGREASERMVNAGKGGVIVNISSISRAGNAGQSNYSAAKSGVMALTVTWAKELARYGIRVGAIAPGFTRTSMVAGMRPEVLEKALVPVPLKRLGEPEEIAHAAAFIFENDFFTGRCLELDGGLRL